ncbi:hypothetical protein [Moraxella lacunata]
MPFCLSNDVYQNLLCLRNFKITTSIMMFGCRGVLSTPIKMTIY